MCGLKDRATVVNKQLDESTDPGVSHVMCRAIDGFSKKIPRILNWSKDANLILFAGENVRRALDKAKVKYDRELLPMSERRYIFHIDRSAKIANEGAAETTPISLDEDNLLEV